MDIAGLGAWPETDAARLAVGGDDLIKRAGTGRAA